MPFREAALRDGSGEEIAIRDLAALVARATGYRGEVVWDTSKPNGQLRRRLATDRARALLGFEVTAAPGGGARHAAAVYGADRRAWSPASPRPWPPTRSTTGEP